MHSIAHVLLFGSMVAAAIGALTFCLVLAAFGFTPAEGQPDRWPAASASRGSVGWWPARGSVSPRC